jgi:dihydrofolate synthase/folylpolyglutamate synthase|tara:strand:+ start:2233 stop:3525 length:1293 start_codon:yes stop_codon:yes gene_type:complete
MADPQPILERLQGLYPKLIDLKLDRARKLLDELGAPHMKMPPVVHVSGTNGKGSVIALMRSALEAAGTKVHVYTSPHLVRFNERIRVAGQVIDDESLSEILEVCEEANKGRPITFFEITTVAAFLAFSRTPADLVLLETGLGGRFDATNTIREAALTIIMPVSMDHQQYLGDTLTEIAAEKAGILKPGVSCIVARQPDEAMDAIAEMADEVGAPLVVGDMDWTIRFGLEEMTVNLGGHIRHLSRPGLEGPHQAHNAGVAVAALDHLEGFNLSDDAISEGFRNAEWPARLQRIRRGLLRGQLGHEFALWLDGGHNKGAADALASWLAERDGMPLHLILGMLNTKDPAAFLEPLRPYLYSLRTVDIPGTEAAFGADELAAIVKSSGFNATPAVDLKEALREIARIEPGPARVLIAGSLYLAGLVLADSGENT